jgi:hypothetical protein
MSDLLSYLQEAGQFSNYKDYLASKRDETKELISQGAETLAEGSPLLVDTFRNVSKLYGTGKKFLRTLEQAGDKIKETGEKAVGKAEDILTEAKGKAQEVATQVKETVQKAIPKPAEEVKTVEPRGIQIPETRIEGGKLLGQPSEVTSSRLGTEMKTFESPLENVSTARKVTFTPASQETQNRSLADYLRQKADARLEGRTRSRMIAEQETDPENLLQRIQLSDVRDAAIKSITKEPVSISAPESFETVGKAAIEQASQALKPGAQGIQEAASQAEMAGREALQAGKEVATRAMSAASEAGEAAVTLAKEGAEQIGKEAAATAADVALEAIPVVGEVLGTGALLYQGIKDLFSGSRSAPTVESAAPVFTPGISRPL